MAKKIVATRYGNPSDVIELIDQDVPEPGRGQVVVQVRAAGVNPFDTKRVRGLISNDENALPLSLGGEAAGTVHAAGEGSGVAVGDEVIVYSAVGAFADYVVADARDVYARPEGLDVDAAAGLLLAGTTAVDLVESLNVGSDDVLLVHGGAGAVGAIVVNRAIARGATVIATASPANHDYLRGLGATPVAYGDGLLDAVRAAATSPVTVVADTVGADAAIDVSLELVQADRIASIAAWGRAGDGIILLGGADPDSRRRRREAVEPLIEAAAAGDVVVEIAGTFALAEAAKALERAVGKHPRGKYVLHP